MATILNRITDTIRVDIADEMSSRFSNAQLLSFFKQAVRRAQGIGYKNRLKFMREKVDFTLAATESSYLLPTNFIVQYGVWRKDNNLPIKQITEDEYEEITDPEELSGYIIEGSYIVFLGAPVADTSIRMRYYKDALPDSLTVASNMPWGGKLDYVIMEYVNMRALHIDRYDLSIEMALTKDMERAILGMYLNLDTNVGEARGPF